MEKHSVKKKNKSPDGKDTHKSLPPIYFLSVTVENVRCFGPKQTIDLSDGSGHPAQWTIILGDNGVGKTTLLQSIVAMAPAWDGETFLPWGYTQFPYPYQWRPYRHKGDIAADIVGSVYYGAKLTDNTSGKIIKNYSLSMSRDDSEKKLFFSMADCIEITAPPIPTKDGMTEVGRLILVCSYGAVRRMGTTSLSGNGSDDSTATLYLEDAALMNAEEWLLQIDYAASKPSSIQKKSEKKREEVKDILINILPDVEEIRITEPTEEEQKPRVEFRTPYGWVFIHGLGMGYRSMIAWIVDLARRLYEKYPDSPNPLAEPAVVLVDEIDLHLHPRWQRTLMKFLSDRFVNTQFIVTAHSPLIAQAAGNANVVVLRKEDDHVVIDKDIKEIRHWRVDQILTSDLFGLESARSPKLEELLGQRKKILSKGKLSSLDKKKLRELEVRIPALPGGEQSEDREAMDIIHRAAELLKKR